MFILGLVIEPLVIEQLGMDEFGMVRNRTVWNGAWY